MESTACALLEVATRESGCTVEAEVDGRLYARFDFAGESSKKDGSPGEAVHAPDEVFGRV